MLILYFKIWRAARRLARQDRHLLGLDRQNSCVEKNGTEHSDLLEKELSSDGRNSVNGKMSNGKTDRKYLHRPSSFFHAVKAPLVGFEVFEHFTVVHYNILSFSRNHN